MNEGQTKNAYKALPLNVVQTDAQLFSIRFSSCGSFLLGAAMDSRVRRWRVSVEEPAASEDPKAAAATKKTTTVCTLQELAAVEGFKGWVQALAVQEKGDVAVAADSWGAIVAWDACNDALAVRWRADAAHDGWVRQLALSPDGSRLVSCSRDGWVRLWDARDGKKIAQIQHPEEVYCVAFSNDGKRVAYSDLHCNVTLAEAETLKQQSRTALAEFFLLSRMQEVTGLRQLRFTKDDATLLAVGSKPSSGGFVEGAPLWVELDLASGKPRESVKMGAAKDGFILDIVRHPDGFHLGALSGQPGMGRLIFFKEGAKEPFFSDPSLANCQSVAVDPTGKLAVVACTSKGSNGNGKTLSKDGQYLPNSSPLHCFSLHS
jgi:WD40 repeat protein